MCMSSPKTPQIQQVAATPPPPPPAETATTVKEPTGQETGPTTLARRRRGISALRITRETATNVPTIGSGVNV